MTRSVGKLLPFCLIAALLGPSCRQTEQDLPAIPPRGEVLQVEAWERYIRNTLYASYPEYRRHIERIDIFITQDAEPFIGSVPGEDRHELYVTTGALDVFDTPLECAIILGHELGHMVLHQEREIIDYELALEDEDPTDLFRMTAEELDADMFSVLAIRSVPIEQSVCTSYTALGRLQEHFIRKPPRRNEMWHLQQRVDLMMDWCQRALEDGRAQAESH